MAELVPPVFIDETPSAVLAAMIADYEARTGKTLQPAQLERLLINAFAFRESTIRTVINETARQNLVAFANAPVLDRLGDLVGVVRTAPTAASCNIRFTLIASHTGVTIPENFRVASADGKAVFATVQSTVVNAGVTTVDVECEAIAEGTAANGYTAGQINTIVNPPVWMVSAANLNTTGGGAEEETDEQFRERIKLAPSAFSVAGSRDSYKFFASGANASIIDVAVLGPPNTPPGTVRIYPLVSGGISTPTQVLEAVEAACNDDRVRPLSDIVEVLSPSKVEYTLAVSLTILDGYVAADIIEVVDALLTNLTETKYQRLGRDLTHSEIIAACMIEGVYSVTPTINSGGPVSPLVIQPTQFAFCTGITVTVAGSVPG